eukprot:2943205-Pyramimonas_sp.AAC.1
MLSPSPSSFSPSIGSSSSSSGSTSSSFSGKMARAARSLPGPEYETDHLARSVGGGSKGKY